MGDENQRFVGQSVWSALRRAVGRWAKLRIAKLPTVKRLNSNAGNVLLVVIFMAPVAAVLIGSLINIALTARKQSVLNTDRTNIIVLLDGALDYTTYAIKAQWCLKEDWRRDVLNCDLTHEGNFERLIMDNNTVQSVRSLNRAVAGFDATTIQLTEIQTTLDLQTLANDHPFLPLVQNLAGPAREFAKNLVIVVRRIDNENTPQRGRESHIQISATVHSSGGAIYKSLTSVTSHSRLMVAPRELNYFTMIVGNNLYVDGSTAAPQPGDAFFPLGTKGQRGVTFDGPVFVNGDVHVPAPDAATYTPVTFVQRVVLGGADVNGVGGRIMTNGTPYAPASFGGAIQDSYYSQMNAFGAFKSGVDVDGRRDLGLDFLFVPSGVNTGAMNECIQLNRIRTDLAQTKDVPLVLALMASDKVCNGNCTTRLNGANKAVAGPSAVTVNTATVRMRLMLPGDNYFFPQSVSPARYSTVPGWSPPSGQVPISTPYPFKKGSLVGGEHRSLMQMTVAATDAAGNTKYEYLTMGANSEFRFDLPASSAAHRANKISIKVAPVTDIPGLAEPLNYIDVVVTADGYIPDVNNVKISIEAFDVAYWAGRDRREEDATGSLKTVGVTRRGEFNVSGVGGNGGLVVPGAPLNQRLIAAPTGASSYAAWAGAKPDNYDLKSKLEACGIALYAGAIAESSGSAFKSVGWNTSFTSSTRASWYFAPVDSGTDSADAYRFVPAAKAGGSIVQTLTIKDPADPSDQPHFEVKSIAGVCRVPANVRFFAGFFVCDRFIVEARSQPLEFVGTIIAGRLQIDPSVYDKGWTLRSIYHPRSTIKLQATQVLKNNSNGACSSAFGVGAVPPIWWPSLPVDQYSSFRKCNVVSLRDNANPFTWTTVDPDCGLEDPNTSTSVVCKKRAVRYLVRELARDSSLQ